jgi:hypothetical protein
MAFSGSWLSGAMVQDPQGAVQHVADPVHAIRTDDQGVQVATYQTPAVDGGITASPYDTGEYPGAEWIVETGGRVLDSTDYESHQRDNGDRGAEKAAVFGEPITQFAGERYVNERFEGITGQDINPVALQRGRNGLSENNPDGFRRGWQEQNWVDRKFPTTVERIHDHRIIFPDTSFAQTQGAPPVTRGPYPLPFGALAKSITSVNMRPQARREPPPLNADLIDDGSPIDVAQVDSWVVG